jgi:hypothetical protein
LKVLIYQRGENKEVHFNELFSKMIPMPDSGYPRMVYYWTKQALGGWK